MLGPGLLGVHELEHLRMPGAYRVQLLTTLTLMGARLIWLEPLDALALYGSSLFFFFFFFFFSLPWPPP